MSPEPSPDPAEWSEAELVIACADRRAGSWEELLERYERLLHFVCRRSLRARQMPSDRDDVEEAVAQVLALLVADDGRVLRSFRGDSKLSTWLAVIATRRVARIGRKRRIRSVSIDALTEDQTTHLAADAGVESSDDERPDAGALIRAMEQLSERDRRLLQMAFLDDRTYRDIADAIGVAEGSIGQYLFRAKKRLRKIMEGKK